MLVNFIAIWSFKWPFGIFYGHLVYFSRFGKLQQEKSGNPAATEYKIFRLTKPSGVGVTKWS
jgi:hypothetical protein